MGIVTVHSATTKTPLTLAGEFAGECWGANTTDVERNYKRGLDCLRSGHGKTLEFAQIYLIIDGYSARVIRELYTHQSGMPSKLQASTRYINYENFDYIVPKLDGISPASVLYNGTMQNIAAAAQRLEKGYGIKREDAAMLLPLGMETKMVYRTNLRALIDMAKVRMCSRAYHEYRQLMNDIIAALREYSDEWRYLIDEEMVFKPKCEHYGFCDETHSCGRKPRKEDLKYMQDLIQTFHTNLRHIPQNETELIQALYDIGGKDDGRTDN